MQVEVRSKAFKYALERVKSLSAQGGVEDHLVSIRAEDGAVWLSRSHESSSISTVVVAAVMQPGAITVDVRPLAAYLKYASAIDPMLSVWESGGHVRVSAMAMALTLNGVSGRSSPAKRTLDGAVATLSTGDLAAIRALTYAVSRQNATSMSGFHVYPDGTVVATDGYRLAATSVAALKDCPEVTVPVNFLSPWVQEGASGVSIAISGGIIMGESEDTNISLPLLAGKYPDVAGVLRTPRPWKFHVARPALIWALQALRSVGLSRRDVHFHFDGSNEFVLWAPHASGHTGHMVSYEGHAIYGDVTLDGEYLCDALASSRASRLLVRFSDDTSAVEFCAGDGRHLVMPIVSQAAYIPSLRSDDCSQPAARKPWRGSARHV